MINQTRRGRPLHLTKNGKHIPYIVFFGTEPEFYIAQAAFETLGVYNYHILQLEDHLKRLKQSAQLMGFSLPYSLEKIQAWVERHLMVRKKQIIIIIAGKTNIYILSFPQEQLPTSIYKHGAKLSTYCLERPCPGAKKLSFWEEQQAYELAHKQRSIDTALLDRRGHITECSHANIFFVKNNSIYTPRKNILFGLMRKLIIDLAKKDYQIKERNIALTSVKTFSECFITRTSYGAVPIIKIGNITIDKGKPGLVTKILIDRYQKYIRNLANT